MLRLRITMPGQLTPLIAEVRFGSETRNTARVASVGCPSVSNRWPEALNMTGAARVKTALRHRRTTAPGPVSAALISVCVPEGRHRGAVCEGVTVMPDGPP